MALLISPLLASAEPPSPMESPVSVRLKGAPVAAFLDTISAQTKINFILAEGLETKKVTAFLQTVTPRSKQSENLITRIYTLDYASLTP